MAVKDTPAFINAIAEKRDFDEAIEQLKILWKEYMALRKEYMELKAELVRVAIEREMRRWG